MAVLGEDSLPARGPCDRFLQFNVLFHEYHSEFLNIGIIIICARKKKPSMLFSLPNGARPPGPLINTVDHLSLNHSSFAPNSQTL